MGQFQTLEDVLGMIRRRIMLIVGVVMIGAALSLFYALGQPRIYESRAVIQIELANISGETAGGSQGNPATRAKYRLNLIEQQLMSRDSLLKIADALGLFTAKPLSDAEKTVALRHAINLDQIVDQAAAWRPDAVPSGLSITVRLGNARQAADTANLLLARIVEQSEARRVEQASAALDFFEHEEARVGAKIAALETDIAAFKTANAASLPEGLGTLRDQLATLREAELGLEREIIGLKTNPGRLREDVLALQISELEGQRQLVLDRIEGIETALVAAPEVERRMNQLGRELTQLQEQFSVITRRRAEAEMGQALTASQQTERFEVLESAQVPDAPISPSRKKLLAAGLAISLVLGVALALLLEALNPAIYTARQLERELGVVPIVSIPNLDTSATGQTGHRARWIAGGVALAAAAGGLAWSVLRRTAALGWDAIGNLARKRRSTRRAAQARRA